MNVALLVGAGRGRTLESILQADYAPTKIDFVVAIGPPGGALSTAAMQHVPTLPIRRNDFPLREVYEDVIERELRVQQTDLICLVGFMHLLSPGFCERWTGRILNLHPGLLPAFAGKDPQKQALEYGVKIAGTTVHFVDAGTDSGPILAQATTPVYANDTLETLSGRLRELGGSLYVTAIKTVARGEYRLNGRRVWTRE